MRLLKFDGYGELSLTNDLSDNIPPYAILSHTWGADEEEVTFDDLKDGSGKSKAGYEKIQFCGEQAQKDDLQYFWVDTCAIDKANHTELAEAIVSMYRWYCNADKCYVYMTDVSTGAVDKNSQPERTWEADFRKSRWFTRGWTLQELLAPKSVEFFSREGAWLGDKHTLERLIHEITEIPLTALRGIPLPNFSVEERMRWAAKRKTKRKEDEAYCLLGIFNVFMSPIYGEGENAFIRLQYEIDRVSGSKVVSNKIPSARDARPVWYVPFSQTSDFVGRTGELQHLKRKIEEFGSSQIVSILGLGGVGKSRLALELVYQIHSEHPHYSHFWIEATDRLTFERDMREVGKKLGIPGIKDDKADIRTLVKQWLNNSSERWLLILDNADDEALWGKRSNTNGPQSTLVDWLPSSANDGFIIVTTRSRRVASHLAGKAVTELTAMPPDEAKKMFINALERPEMAAEENATSTLLEKLTYLPLAIFQAASYMNMTQEPLTTYLELMEEPEEEVVKLLSEDFGDRSRYSSAHNPVATTWLISFNHIREYQPIAAQFLSSMACLHEKNIPESLLPEVDSRKDAVDALATLKGYSFVTKQTGNKGEMNHEAMYDMHRLVHLAARSWLRKEGTLPDWTRTSVARLARLFPSGDHQYKDVWTAYLPHAQRLCEGSVIEDFPEQYQLLEKMGHCLFADGKYSEAVNAHTAVVHWREDKLGISNEQTLRAYNYLGEVLNWEGDYCVAEQYLQKALQRQKEVVGPEHPDTLTSMSNLASTYRKQGQWKKAEELEAQVIEKSIRVLGVEHPDTLTSMSSLASVYRNQGQWKKAEELEVQVIEKSIRVLGAEHPHTLISIGNLVSTYWKQGQWKKAEELEVQVMEKRIRVLGAEHPHTLISMNNLASIYRNQGQWKKAEELEVQVIEKRIRVLGAEHPDTLTSIGNLASIYWNQGQWKKAEELEVQVMEKRIRVLGAEHPDTLTSIGNLASTYRKQGQWKKAEELEAQVMEKSIRVLGAEHPDTLTSIGNLASTYWKQGQWKKAEELEAQVMEKRIRVLGAEHPHTLTSMSNLASVYREQGQWKKAEELKVQVMEKRIRVLGAEHPDTLTSIANLAYTLKDQTRNDEAIQLMTSCREIREKVLGSSHPDTQTAVEALEAWLNTDSHTDSDQEVRSVDHVPGAWVE